MARTWYLEAQVVTAGVWTDITEYASDVYWSRGGAYDQDVMPAGQMQIVLENDDGRFSPENTTSPYTGRVVPGIKVRLRVTLGSFTYTLFTGKAVRWQPQWPSPGDRQLETVLLDVLDGFEEVRQTSVGVLFRDVTFLTGPDRHWYLDGDQVAQPDVMAGKTAVLNIGTAGGSVTQPALQASPVVYGATGSYQSSNGAAIGYGILPTDSATNGSASTFAVGMWVAQDGNSLIAGCGRDNTTGGASDFYGAAGAAWLLHDKSGTLLFAHGDGTSYEEFDTGVDIADGEPHWILAVRTASTVTVYVDGVSAVSSSYSLTPLTQGRTYIGGWQDDQDETSFVLDNQFDGRISDVTFWSADPTASLPGSWTLANWYAAGATGLAGLQPGTHINRLLDVAGWPTADRDLKTGSTTIAGLEVGTNVLDRIQQAGFTDLGLVYAKPNGKIRFTSRDHLWRNLRTSTQTFSDTAVELAYDDGIYDSVSPYVPGVLYSRAHFGFDTVRLHGRVEVADTVGTQTSEDATSVTAYGRRTLSQSTITDDTDDTLYRTQWLLNRFKDPKLRVPTLAIDQMTDTEGAAVCQLDLGDLVTVELAPPAGDAVAKQVRLWGMRHRLTGVGRQWSCELDLVDADEELEVGIYGTSLYGSAVYGY